MFEIFWVLLISIARLLGLTDLWCEAAVSVSYQYPESAVPFAVASPVRQAAVFGDDVVVVSGLGSERRLERSTSRRGTEELMPATRALVPGGEYFFARGDTWWYGLSGERDKARGTYFVSSDGNSTLIPPSGIFTNLWLPLKTKTPRALELFVDEERQNRAAEIDTTGTIRSWHLPMISRVASAELLADGRIALVLHHQDSERLILALLGDDNRVDTINLGYKSVIQLTTAIDSSGRLAIAVATRGRSVHGAVIDPGEQVEPVWNELRQGILLYSGTGDVRVTPVSGSFVVAWINRENGPTRIEAANLHRSFAGNFATIGRLVDRGRASEYSLRTEDGEPVFTWDDGQHIRSRRLSPFLAGHAVIEELSDLYCRSNSN